MQLIQQKRNIWNNYLFVWKRGCKTLLNCSSKIVYISNLSDVSKFIFLSERGSVSLEHTLNSFAYLKQYLESDLILVTASDSQTFSLSDDM